MYSGYHWMNDDINYKAAYERQKRAREIAEESLEEMSRELYDSSKKVAKQKAQLAHQERLASLGQLSAGIAHEINNPTGFIKSNINSLKTYYIDIKDLLDHYQKLQHAINNGQTTQDISNTIDELADDMDLDYLINDIDSLISESLEGIERIHEIIMSMKNFSRADKSFQLININDCIENTIKLVNNEIKYTCQLKTDYGDIPNTYANMGQLGQVFLNLLTNAGQAIVSSGTINITTTTDGDNITIIVADNGSGIPDEIKRKIFKPFFTTKGENEGTGLGLSISHGIIEEHQGTITVDSVIDEGTTFTITLPVATSC